MKAAVYNIKGENLGREVELPDSIFGLELGPNHEHVVYLAVKQYLANQRQGTHKSKQRNEISGSTRKLHKQKGTGGSRKGGIKNPLYRGGGRIFGPQPRDYSIRLNKKVKQLARKAVLSAKAKEGKLVIVEDFKLDAPKTKSYKAVLSAIKVGEKALLDGKSLMLMNMPAAPTAPARPARPRQLRGAKNRAQYMQSLKDYVAALREYHKANKAYTEQLARFESEVAQGYKNIWLAGRNLKNADVINAKDFNVYQVLKADYLILSESSVASINQLFA